MSLAIALRGARVELLQVAGLVPKIRCFARLSGLMLAEVMGTMGFARYGWHAMCLHRDLTLFGPLETGGSIQYNEVYGPKPRNLMDVYHPITQSVVTNTPSVVLFVHGGVWSSGEKWHYAPLARSLSMRGVTACVMSYTLYPEATAMEIVEEVNLALDWVMDNVLKSFSVDPHITLVGHSSGAHSVVMAVMERAKQAKKMPDKVVAMCGVYDIATHYEYERGRGVHELSSMKPAMRGHQNFTEQSPTCMLSQFVSDNPDASLNGISMDHVKRLPKIELMTSDLDTTVPSSQSVALHEVLQKLDCESKCTVYKDVLHSHFATKAWTYDLYDKQENTPSHVFISDFISAISSQTT